MRTQKCDDLKDILIRLDELRRYLQEKIKINEELLDLPERNKPESEE